MTGSVGRRAASGAAWNLATSVTARVFGLAGTLFLTRHLAPAAFGEVSAALVCATILSQTLNFAFGTYVIVHRSRAAEAFQGFVFHLAAIGLGCAGILLVGDSLAGFLGVPGMARYLPGVALAMLITSIGAVPSATLVRALRFRVVAFARAAGEAAYTTVAVALVVPLGDGPSSSPVLPARSSDRRCSSRSPIEVSGSGRCAPAVVRCETCSALAGRCPCRGLRRLSRGTPTTS